MKLRPTYIMLDACKRLVFIVFMGLIATSFVSKNILSDYANESPVEIVEILENGSEDKESEREEVQEQFDDYTNFGLFIIAYLSIKVDYVGNKVLCNSCYNETLTQPPEREEVRA